MPCPRPCEGMSASYHIQSACPRKAVGMAPDSKEPKIQSLTQYKPFALSKLSQSIAPSQNYLFRHQNGRNVGLFSCRTLEKRSNLCLSTSLARDPFRLDYTTSLRHRALTCRGHLMRYPKCFSAGSASMAIRFSQLADLPG